MDSTCILDTCIPLRGHPACFIFLYDQYIWWHVFCWLVSFVITSTIYSVIKLTLFHLVIAVQSNDWLKLELHPTAYTCVNHMVCNGYRLSSEIPTFVPAGGTIHVMEFLLKWCCLANVCKKHKWNGSSLSSVSLLLHCSLLHAPPGRHIDFTRIRACNEEFSLKLDAVIGNVHFHVILT